MNPRESWVFCTLGGGKMALGDVTTARAVETIAELREEYEELSGQIDRVVEALRPHARFPRTDVWELVGHLSDLSNWFGLESANLADEDALSEPTEIDLELRELHKGRMRQLCRRLGRTKLPVKIEVLVVE